MAHYWGCGKLGALGTGLGPSESWQQPLAAGVWNGAVGPLPAPAWPHPGSCVAGKTMASAAAATTEKGSPVVVGLLVVGNIIILLSGLALFAETVWVTADQYRVYPLMGVSGKDDVFAGAWIAIFCGFSFFVVASFGVGAVLSRHRSMMLTYLVLMLTVYIFECASCITSYTHRDYMVSSPSLITKQMLTFYSADSDQGRELTRLWDRIMIEQECCGTSGPMDWVNFTSAFRATTPEVVFPWPPLCCRRTGNFIPLSEEGCRLGHLDYLFTKSTGSGRAGSAAMAHGPSRSVACGIFPDQAMNPCPLHRQADSQPLRHQAPPKMFYQVSEPCWELGCPETPGHVCTDP
ncbi:uroplakin-1a isoform X1 [Globicephala melas]|uniref:uroplakin-1a isoform X1 n=2 Tax=Globicephala melas TaxID=9731 RepID=UPI00293D9709|nr:uroplakin-1a isoform X1 [Globicephala melas]